MRLGFVAAIVLAWVFVSTAQAQECKKHSGRTVGTAVVAYFDTGSTKIKKADQASLREFAKQVKDHPSIEICLVGQADKQGNVDANKRLAKRRAEAVRTFLKKNGLAKKTYQIVVRGEAFGDTWLGKLFADTKFKHDRRVEVTAIEL